MLVTSNKCCPHNANSKDAALAMSTQKMSPWQCRLFSFLLFRPLLLTVPLFQTAVSLTANHQHHLPQQLLHPPLCLLLWDEISIFFNPGSAKLDFCSNRRLRQNNSATTLLNTSSRHHGISAQVRNQIEIPLLCVENNRSNKLIIWALKREYLPGCDLWLLPYMVVSLWLRIFNFMRGQKCPIAEPGDKN